jgi:hypothetical protein
MKLKFTRPTFYDIQRTQNNKLWLFYTPSLVQYVARDFFVNLLINNKTENGYSLM